MEQSSLPMTNNILSLRQVSVLVDGHSVLRNISVDFFEGDACALIGESGSGKTVFANVVSGVIHHSSGTVERNLPTDKIVLVPQQHDFRNLYAAKSYYQQRFDLNYGTDVPTVNEILLRNWEEARNKPNLIEEHPMVELLQISKFINRQLIQLSNGEGKRLQLLLALLMQPSFLILDNPFIGLDTESRGLLHSIINHLIKDGIFVLLITTPHEIPEGITHVLTLEQGAISSYVPKSKYRLVDQANISPLTRNFTEIEAIKSLMWKRKDDFEIAVKMNNVSVKFGDTIVLQNINWTIHQGERWALSGPNGAGKSTLLSLINGDNPQAYLNDITLFGRQRGSGESIWDVKKNIGYLSPELHIYFLRNASHTYAHAVSKTTSSYLESSRFLPGIKCVEVVASGFQDQVGSSSFWTDSQRQQVLHWLRLFDIVHLKDHTFATVSIGAQRLVLLARALIKNPAMLILDEPCQGLDTNQTEHFKAVIDMVCNTFEKTLIYVSHYKEEIPSCVNLFLELENGRMVE